MPLCWARHSTTPCINDRHNIHTPATPIRWKRENIKTQEKKNASGRDSTIALCSICKMYGAAKNSHAIWAGLEVLWRHTWSNVEHRPSSNRWPSSCHWERFLHRSLLASATERSWRCDWAIPSSWGFTTHLLSVFPEQRWSSGTRICDTSASWHQDADPRTKTLTSICHTEVQQLSQELWRKPEHPSRQGCCLDVYHKIKRIWGGK